MRRFLLFLSGFAFVVADAVESISVNFSLSSFVSFVRFLFCVCFFPNNAYG